MIRWIQIENFKNLAKIEAKFDRVNAIIGPNGCGKSSLLQAIDFLRAFFSPSIENYLQDRDYRYEDFPNLRQAKKAIRWKLLVSLGANKDGGCAGDYEYTVTTRRWRYLGIGEEKLQYTPPGGETRVLMQREGRKLTKFGEYSEREYPLLERMPRSLLVDLDGGRAPDTAQMIHFREWIMSIRYFLIWDPKVLRKPDRGKHLELGQSGEHIAPLLAYLKREAPAKFLKIVERVTRLFPTVSDITIRGGRGWGWQEINLVEANGRNVHFNSQQMSDGVLRLLAITTFLYSDKLPGVLMLEEPENGIHPQLLQSVIQTLRELTLRKDAPCQVFFTTHSPYVLDEFRDNPDNVYVMERGRPQEGASISRLSDRADIDLAQRLFKHSLGEAWFSGVLGGTAKEKG